MKGVSDPEDTKLDSNNGLAQNSVANTPRMFSSGCMMTSSNGNIFRVTGHLRGEFPVNSPHKGQWRGALMFSLVYVWINGWVNNREAGDLRRYRTRYDATVMEKIKHIDLVALRIWEILR